MAVFRSFFALLLLGIALFMPRAAEAAFLFCNQTKTVVEGAFGYREQADWLSEGWWQIQPGQCARVFSKPLTQRFYFYYARVLAPPKDGKPAMIWGGKYLFCIDNKAFKITGDGKCEKRGYREQGFQQVDVTNRKDYTLTFDDGKGR